MASKIPIFILAIVVMICAKDDKEELSKRIHLRNDVEEIKVAEKSPNLLSQESPNSRVWSKACKSAKCKKSGGTCLPKNSNITSCNTYDQPFCSGDNCTCCVKDAKSCTSTIDCRFWGGFCIRPWNKKKKLCPGGKIYKDLCTGPKCGCCIPKGKSCKCGIANKHGVVRSEDAETRILNGTEILQHKYPWFVGVIVYYHQNQEYYWNWNENLEKKFAGTIINSNYVLTAAYVVYTETNNIKSISVQVAPHSHSRINQIQLLVEVEYYIIHKKFKFWDKYQNNIALLKLKETLAFDNRISPICLPSLDKNYANMSGTVVGWETEETHFIPWFWLPELLTTTSPASSGHHGTTTTIDTTGTTTTGSTSTCHDGTTSHGTTTTTTTTTTPSPNLHEVNLEIYEKVKKEGKPYVLDIRGDMLVKASSDIICAGTEQGTRITEQDIGGPLFVEIKGKSTLVGIVGQDFLRCYPNIDTHIEFGVYTKVTAFMQWIFQNIADQGMFCKFYPQNV